MAALALAIQGVPVGGVAPAASAAAAGVHVVADDATGGSVLAGSRWSSGVVSGDGSRWSSPTTDA